MKALLVFAAVSFGWMQAGLADDVSAAENLQTDAAVAADDSATEERGFEDRWHNPPRPYPMPPRHGPVQPYPPQPYPPQPYPPQPYPPQPYPPQPYPPQPYPPQPYPQCYGQRYSWQQVGYGYQCFLEEQRYAPQLRQCEWNRVYQVSNNYCR